MSRTIISLTTIPPRFDKIGNTLNDLLNQSHHIDEVRLNLAREYRRFPGELPSLPPLPEGVTVHWCDHDFGPATKVLPTVLDHRGEDTEILFCDDDLPYEPTWAARFFEARKSHPNACIASKGYDLDSRMLGHRYALEDRLQPRVLRRRKTLSYRLLRLLTLGLVKPSSYIQDGYVDILEGYRGALVRPEFFPKEVFDIPDILWTVDDPWLSGHLTRNNVPIWMLADAPSHAAPYSAHYSERLVEYVYQGHGRLEADSACIDYFRDTYGIWPGLKETPDTVPKPGFRQFFLGQDLPVGGS